MEKRHALVKKLKKINVVDPEKNTAITMCHCTCGCGGCRTLPDGSTTYNHDRARDSMAPSMQWQRGS